MSKVDTPVEVPRHVMQLGLNEKHFAEPQVGDHWHEMFCPYFNVVDVLDNGLIVVFCHTYMYGYQDGKRSTKMNREIAIQKLIDGEYVTQKIVDCNGIYCASGDDRDMSFPNNKPLPSLMFETDDGEFRIKGGDTLTITLNGEPLTTPEWRVLNASPFHLVDRNWLNCVKYGTIPGYVADVVPNSKRGAPILEEYLTTKDLYPPCHWKATPRNTEDIQRKAIATEIVTLLNKYDIKIRDLPDFLKRNLPGIYHA